MSFNKRYINKEDIILAIKNDECLGRLVKADCLIMDSWSSKFFDEYNFKKEYKQDRDELISLFQFSSKLSDTYNHPSFSKLGNLSNIYENLIKDNNWLEILLTLNVLGNDGVSDDMNGKFNRLKEHCITKIENYFKGEARSRSKKIETIIDESK